MLKLQFVDGRQKSIWLVDESFTIGSAQGNNLVIDEPGISASHIEIISNQDQLRLRVIDTSALTSLNNQKLLSAAPLKAGDIIQLGNTKLQIIDPKATKAALGLGLSETDDENSLWKLKATASWMGDKTYPVKNKMTIGRDPSCEISIKVEHLSRQHAELEVKGGRLLVRDLGSANGTFINGKPIKETFVNAGDKLKLDVVTFEVIGPESDANKTVIRMSNAKAPASANQNNMAGKAQDASGSATKSKKPAATHEKSAPSTQATTPESSSNRKPPIAILVGVGFVVTLSIIAAVILL